MYTKYLVPALCAAAFLDSAGASPSGHRHLHKKDIKYIATEVEIVTDIVYVTVTEGVPVAAATPATATPAAQAPESMYKGAKPAYPVRPVSDSPVVEAAPITTSTPSAPPPPPATSIPAAPSSAPAPPPAPPVQEAPAAPSPTTMATSIKPAPSSSNPIVSLPTEAAAVASSVVPVVAKPSNSPSTAPSKNTGRRGLAYNDPSLVKTVLGMSGKFSWVYNWGSTDGGLDVSLPITFYPTLWGPQPDHTQGWSKHAQAAIDAGADALMSFNECDNSGQCNTAADVAAAKHKEYMGPFVGKARILAPAITSSQDPGQGIQWLEAFEKACGSDCPYDAVNAHWYGPGGKEGAEEFLGHLVKVHEAANGRPVWVTEFAATNGDTAAFMSHALDELDNNSKYSFVEKYAYFYLATGSLMDTATSLSSIGNIYVTQ